MEQETIPPAGEPDASSGFRPPRRRKKTLLSITLLVLGVVVFLVYLMALGPSEERIANELVEDTLAALPDGALSAADIRDGAQGLQRALRNHPMNDSAIEAQEQLAQRVAQQVETDIENGELERADKVLTEAATHWPEEGDFAEDGGLRGRVDEALERRALMREVGELIAAAEERLTDGPERAESIRDALDMLRRSLELDPENERARSAFDGIRRKLEIATREALDAGEPQRAGELLDAFDAEVEWSGDPGLARLRDEVQRQLGALDKALEIGRLVDLAERRLAADRLTTPAGESAADYFRRVLALDAGNAAAKQGMQRIANRYVVLIGDAVDTGAHGRARRLLGSLEAVAPQHSQIPPLRARIEAGERIVAAGRDAKPERAKDRYSMPSRGGNPSRQKPRRTKKGDSGTRSRTVA